MLWQVYRRKAAAFAVHLSICIIAAVLGGQILTYAWRASPRLAFVPAVLLFGAGLFQLARRKTSFGRAVSVGVLFGVFVSSAGALYGIVIRSFPVLSVLLGTIHGPEDFTDAQAKDYFDQHQETFIALLHLISQCEGRGTMSIYPDGHVLAILSDEAVKCPSAKEIAAQLKAANVLWVNVSGNKPYGEPGLVGAMFVLSSRGIVGHGSGSAIYYFPELKTNPFGDSFPLEGTPGHWFYRGL
jgi:hypothetical protein